MRLRRIIAAGAATALVGALALALTFGGTRSVAADEKAAAAAPEAQQNPPRQSWSFYGPFGKYDRAQLQRGYQVYREVCANCHSMKLVAFRDLAASGGPSFSDEQVKALAATFKVKDGPNQTGDMFERPGRPSDYFPSPFPNPEAAAAALGAAPPDMSLVAKARDFERGFPLFLVDAVTQYQEEGVDYIYALLNGYTKADDPNFNEWFPGHHIAMPPPLSDGAVAYTDGSPQTLQQYAKDVAAFLQWAAEPKLEARKSLGFAVLIYLAVFAVMLYLIKRRIWAKIPH
ncbi:cytochrome c1 [Methylocella sp.]|jgi:cytochrome c1|uniref:cytochrome c1 n=1 Tax=Methylocella sp. TaxID=1978226 RepID=UPI003C1EB460